MGVFFFGAIALILIIFIFKFFKKLMATLTDFQAQLDSINASIAKITTNAAGTLSAVDSVTLLSAITDIASKLAAIAG